MVSPIAARRAQRRGRAGRCARGDKPPARRSPGGRSGTPRGRASSRRAAGRGGGRGRGARGSLCAGPRAGTSGRRWRAPRGARPAGRCPGRGAARGALGGSEPGHGRRPRPFAARPARARQGRSPGWKCFPRPSPPHDPREDRAAARGGSRREPGSGLAVIQGARGPRARRPPPASSPAGPGLGAAPGSDPGDRLGKMAEPPAPHGRSLGRGGARPSRSSGREGWRGRSHRPFFF